EVMSADTSLTRTLDRSVRSSRCSTNKRVFVSYLRAFAGRATWGLITVDLLNQRKNVPDESFTKHAKRAVFCNRSEASSQPQLASRPGDALPGAADFCCADATKLYKRLIARPLPALPTGDGVHPVPPRNGAFRC